MIRSCAEEKNKTRSFKEEDYTERSRGECIALLYGPVYRNGYGIRFYRWI
jgi:hypothetical protein